MKQRDKEKYLKAEIEALSDRLYEVITALPHDEEAEDVALLALACVAILIIRQTDDQKGYLAKFINTLFKTYTDAFGDP